MQVVKCGIVESVLAWSKFKQDQQLKGKQTGKKTNKLKGIAKLEDANDAGKAHFLRHFVKESIVTLTQDVT